MQEDKGGGNSFSIVGSRKFAPASPGPVSSTSLDSGALESSARLRLVSYNILNGALGIRQRHGPIEEEARTWSARREMITRELKSYEADVVVLQEVSATMALDLEASLLDVGYRLYRPLENLGEEEAPDIAGERYESHAPATFVRESNSLQVIDWHVLKLDSIPLPSWNSETIQRDQTDNEDGKDESESVDKIDKLDGLSRRYLDVCRDARILVTRLRCRNNSSRCINENAVDVIVCNVHLHHNPAEPHIKALQLSSIVKHLQAISRIEGDTRIRVMKEDESMSTPAFSASTTSSDSFSAASFTSPRSHIILAGDFNSVVRKTKPDAFDQPRAGCWDGVSSLPSGVYELCCNGTLQSSHPDHPWNRVMDDAGDLEIQQGAALLQLKKPLQLGMSFSSAYRLANGKEPCVTTKCVDFAATLDYIFLPTNAVQSGEVTVVSTLEMPYNDVHESDTWLGEEAVASVVPELGVSIPSRVFPSDHLAIGCDLEFSLVSSNADLRVIAIGAADTFFKVGHYALRKLSTTSNVKSIRLALPTVVEAKKVCHDIPGIEFSTWNIDDISTLEALCVGFNAMILVPPLDGMCVDISKAVLSVAKKCGIQQVACVGGQRVGNSIYPRPFSIEIEALCRDCGVPRVLLLRLPFFLENLLWHARRIGNFDAGHAAFQYPCQGDVPFPYISCRDVGEVVANFIISGGGKTVESEYRVLELAYPTRTTMHEIASHLSRQLGHQVSFKSCSFQEFACDLDRQKITSYGANEMALLWNAVAEENLGRVTPSETPNMCHLDTLLGRAAISVHDWLDEHLCCFQKHRTCKHAFPPHPHEIHLTLMHPDSPSLKLPNEFLEGSTDNELGKSPRSSSPHPMIQRKHQTTEHHKIRLTHMTGLQREVNAVAFSSDGRFIAGSCNSELHDDGEVIVWSADTGKVYYNLNNNGENTGSMADMISSVLCLCFVPVISERTDLVLVTGGLDGLIRCWDVNSWSLCGTLSEHTREVTSLSLTAWNGGSLDSKRENTQMLLVSGSADLSIRIWQQDEECESGCITWHCLRILTKNVDIVAVAVWPKYPLSSFVAAAVTGTHEIFVWDLHANTNKEYKHLKTKHQDVILSMCLFSTQSLTSREDRIMLATSSKDKTVQIIALHSGLTLFSLSGHHTDYVRCVKHDRITGKLITGSDDGKIILWGMKNQCGESDFLYEGERSAGSEVRVMSNMIQKNVYSKSSIFVSGLRNGSVTLWHVSDLDQKARKASIFKGPTDWVQSVAQSSDGLLIFCGSDDGHCRVWNSKTGELVTDQFCGEVVRSVACSPSGEMFVAGGGATFDPRSHRPPPPPILLVYTLSRISFSLLNSSSVSSPVSVSVSISAPSSVVSLKWRLEGHTQTIRSVYVSKTAEIIISGSDDAQVLVWNARDGTRISSFSGCNNSVRSICLSQTEKFLSAGCWDASVLLWSINDDWIPGELVRFEGHTSPVRSVYISTDNVLLASGSFDDVRLWNRITRECLRVIVDHKDPIDSVVILSNSWILSSSHNALIKVHCIETGLCVRTLKGHGSGVTSLSALDIPPGMVVLVSGSRDKTVRLWTFTLNDDDDLLSETLQDMDPSACGVLQRVMKLRDPQKFRDALHLVLQIILEANHQHESLWHRIVRCDDFSPLVRSMVTHYPSLASVVHPVMKRTAYDLATGLVRGVMNDVLYFCGQFKLIKGRPVHKSSTCVVLLAHDMGAASTKGSEIENEEEGEFSEGDNFRQVVVKAMKNRDQFNREITQRTGLDARFVVPVLTHSNNPQISSRWTMDIASAGFEECRYGFVMEAAQRNLMIVIAQERLDIDDVRNIMGQIALCLQHLHQNGRIHGDFKPLNAVRMRDGRTWKLIDLDACVSIGSLVGSKSKISTAYAPPECIDNPNGVPASIAFDMWSFGVVLFHMLTGKSLFHSNNDDNLANNDEADRLRYWDDDTFNEELARIPLAHNARNRAAKNLLSWLLSRDPGARPQIMTEVLDHCFFQSDLSTGYMRQSVGYFISHAQESGGQQARVLKRLLAESCPTLRRKFSHLEDPIWLDVDEEPLPEKMRQGVRRCSNFLIFLSKGSLRRWFTQMETREAMKLRKKIILVHDEPSPEPTYGGHIDFQQYIEDARAGDEIIIDGSKGNSASLFDNIVSIPYIHRAEFASVSLNLILQAGGFKNEVTSLISLERQLSNSPRMHRHMTHLKREVMECIERNDLLTALTLIQGQLRTESRDTDAESNFKIQSESVSSNVTLSTRSSTNHKVLILCEPLCEQAMLEFRLLLEKEFPVLKDGVTLSGQMLSSSRSGLHHTTRTTASSTCVTSALSTFDIQTYTDVVIFLTCGIAKSHIVLDLMRACHNESTLAIANPADPTCSSGNALKRRVHFLHATDKRHGAAPSLSDIINDRIISEEDCIRFNKMVRPHSDMPPWGKSIPYYSQHSAFRAVSIRLIGMEILECSD